MNLNKTFILGRLTGDPQLRSTTSGQQVATFSLATNRVWYDKNKQKQEQVEYHNIVVWGRTAEISNQFLKKGSLALVEGRMQTRSWQDQQGQNRKTTEIVAERVQIGPRPMGYNNPSQAGGKPVEGVKDAGPIEELPVIDVDAEPKEDLPF
jgi:single-strand DNA-binding protein